MQTTIFLTLILVAFTWAATPTTDIWVSPGVYPSGPSYTVWQEGANYFAKDYKGYLAFSGSNFTTLFNSMTAALDYGGLIYLRRGQYDVDSSLIVRQSGIYVAGEMVGHHASGSRPISGTVLRLTTSGIPMFIWGNSSATVQTYFGGLSNIHLYGQSDNSITGGDAVYVQGGATDLIFEYVFLDLFGDDGFLITANKAKTWNVWIRNCLIESCDVGINITDTLAYDAPPVSYDVYDWTTRLIDRINVQGCHTWGNRRDIDIQGGEIHNILIAENQLYGALGDSVFLKNESRRIQILGNRIYDWGRDGDNLYDGIKIQDNVFDVEIADNIMGDHWEDGDRYSIHLEESCRDIQIHDNDFATGLTETQIVVSSTGARIFIHHNKGYTTEAFGNASASNDDWVSFATTFAGTPQTISLTMNASDARYIAQVKAKNTTHFQLYLYDETAGALETSDKTVMWSAWYQP